MELSIRFERVREIVKYMSFDISSVDLAPSNGSMRNIFLTPPHDWKRMGFIMSVTFVTELCEIYFVSTRK